MRHGQIGLLDHTDLVPPGERGLSVHSVSFAIESGKQLLMDVTVRAQPGTLTALIGPSGAGKSTLAKLIAGMIRPSTGVVAFEGHDLHAENDLVRARIGLVPQDDVLHRQLTVRQALRFAAELRLPPDLDDIDRLKVIDDVLSELSLTDHADTRVDQLSGGQRKRASLALELLTNPSLLLLDEPTSGLDPALDRQVMTLLRALADAGRTVIVVTHSVACLDLCDQVMLLAPGGKTAFCGPTIALRESLGTSDWAEIFARVAADPDRVFENHRSRRIVASTPPATTRSGHGARATKSSGRQQFSTLARRQLQLILADRAYSVFLLALPFVLGMLALVVPGDNGFAPGPLIRLPDGRSVPNSGSESQQLLVVLTLGACYMGSTLTVRDLVGERTIFHRERAAGLRPSAYIMAKVAVFGTTALLQSAIMVAIVAIGKRTPGQGTLLSSGTVELYLGLAATAMTCTTVGLLLSTFVKSHEQVMPLLVILIMGQLVMAGGLIPVTNRVVLEQLSYLFPARWGFAAGAATVDLRGLFFIAQPDKIWQHKLGFWLLDIGMLLALSIVLSVLTWRRLRLPRAAPSRRRASATEPARHRAAVPSWPQVEPHSRQALDLQPARKPRPPGRGYAPDRLDRHSGSRSPDPTGYDDSPTVPINGRVFAPAATPSGCLLRPELPRRARPRDLAEMTPSPWTSTKALAGGRSGSHESGRRHLDADRRIAQGRHRQVADTYPTADHFLAAAQHKVNIASRLVAADPGRSRQTTDYEVGYGQTSTA